MSRTVIAVLGSTGFVGGAVRDTLSTDHDLRPVAAPRLSTELRATGALIREAQVLGGTRSLTEELAGVDVVINAAGDPDASSRDTSRLFGANALLPRVIAEAASAAGVRRLIHVSSAVVQNDRPVLDESEEMYPFSPYSESKVAGELVLRSEPPPRISITRYRPPSVHAPSRRVTVKLAKIASSPLASVAKPGDQPSPQALLPNVAAAVSFLATCEELPPPVVIHPWEGLTAESLMRALGGGRGPRKLPRAGARGVITGARVLGRSIKPVAANARRIELLWFGQQQGPSWLTSQGWLPPVGNDAWDELATLNGNDTGGRQ